MRVYHQRETIDPLTKTEQNFEMDHRQNYKEKYYYLKKKKYFMDEITFIMKEAAKPPPSTR